MNVPFSEVPIGEYFFCFDGYPPMIWRKTAQAASGDAWMLPENAVSMEDHPDDGNPVGTTGAFLATSIVEYPAPHQRLLDAQKTILDLAGELLELIEPLNQNQLTLNTTETML